MSIPINRLRRGGRGVIVAALALAALGSGVVAGAPAASASINCQWQPLSLQNGWQSEQNDWNTGDPAYCIDSGYVYLSGSLAQPSSGSDFFAQLPQQAWPASNLYLSVYTYGGTTGAVTIYTNGAMYAWGSKATSFTSLAGISWPMATNTGGHPLTPLENGWQSADSQWGTGDPSYYLSDGVVHLSGSLNGQAANSWYWAALPPAATPAHSAMMDVYTYQGHVGIVVVRNDNPIGAAQGMSSQFTSLAGVTYPAPGTAETALTTMNGWQPGGSQEGHGPSYFISNGVVYLDGAVLNTGSLSAPFAVLPPGARPTHTLYLTVGTGYTNNDQAVLRIEPNGSMYTYGGPASDYNTPNLWTVFSGISFEVGV